MKKTIYLDYAAATPLDKRVLETMRPYFTTKFYNPSAGYLAARGVRQELESARSAVARQLGAKTPEVIFTAGGTEANNLALLGVLRAFPGTHAVTTALEHESVRLPLEFMATQGNSKTEVAPKVDGTVDPVSVAAAVTDKTVLVSVMYANNEIGTVQPLKGIARQLTAIRERRLESGNKLPLYFHSDACQAANYLDLHAHRLGVDLMSLNGGKIYGPKQSGALFVASHVQLIPLIHGGGQERGLRSGTENTAACVGFARALDIAQAKRPEETRRLGILQKHFLNLIHKKIPRARLNAPAARRLPNNIHVTIPGEDNERLLFALDEAGIQVAAGSACSASNVELSHVLKAIGLSEDDIVASLRFSMGRGTTAAEISFVIETLAKLVA